MAIFACANYHIDAYRARGILPYCEVLRGEECTNRSGADTYYERLYLFVQSESDLVYKRLGIPAVEDPNETRVGLLYVSKRVTPARNESSLN